MNKQQLISKIKKFEKVYVDKSIKRIMLLDGSNHFIINMIKNYDILSNPRNEDSGGIYASINKFLLEYKAIQPDYIITSFDKGGSLKHKKLNKNYKANRKLNFKNRFKTDDEHIQYKVAFSRQIDIFKQFIECLPYSKIIGIPNVEGDFLLAKSKFIIDRLVSDDKFYTLFYIITTDKDFYQLLIDPRVAIINPITGNIITQNNYKDYFIDIRLDQITLSRTIIGDTSDNIKGINGIGKKTTEKIMKYIKKEFCNVDEFLIEIEKIQDIPKKEILLENKDLLNINWKLFNLLNTDNMLGVDAISEIENDINQLVNNTKDFHVEELYNLFIYENINPYNIKDIIKYIQNKYKEYHILNLKNKPISPKAMFIYLHQNQKSNSYNQDIRDNIENISNMDTMKFDEDISGELL